MRGRKPKPTVLKQLLGNPGHRPLNEHEPKPNGVAARPKFLKGLGRKIWDEYAPQAIKIGTLTAIDADLFAVWCCLMAEFRTDPERMVAARVAQLRALASEFGIGASSRTRLKAENASNWQTEDPAEKYFVNAYGHQ
jgi:phage terminase small subunit